MDQRPGRRGYLYRLGLSAGLLAIGATLSMVASRFIDARFPDRPMPHDLLLDALPTLGAAQYAADVTVLLAVTILLVFYVRHDPEHVPEATALFALMYLFRAAIIVLTPLASPHGATTYGIFPPQTGMFPSGHIANALLGWLLVRRHGRSVASAAMAVLLLVEATGLLLSRGHYSIDIVGGMLLTYFVYMEWMRGSIFDPLKRIFIQAPDEALSRQPR